MKEKAYLQEMLVQSISTFTEEQKRLEQFENSLDKEFGQDVEKI